ncbi:MAG TPA: hypothetical protein VFX50_15735, partial [Gemmatimonadales bacterium]|nr:hypothetical protein [Gemmatimonadales bacterium]
DGRWGGQLLVTHRRPDGRYERFTSQVPSGRIRFDTTRADLVLGAHAVTQREGRYRITGDAGGPAGRARFDLEVVPDRHRYFPPVELRSDEFLSGYVVPGLRASARGTVCSGGRCRDVVDAPAYHDHNWGVWRDVTWEWGMGRGRALDLLYGGVISPKDSVGPAGSPFFLAVADSLGLWQVLRFRTVTYEGAQPAGGAGGMSPERFRLVAARESDTLRLDVDVSSAQSSQVGAAGMRRLFLQMRGRFRLEGRVGGQAVRDEGLGFFETYVDRLP